MSIPESFTKDANRSGCRSNCWANSVRDVIFRRDFDLVEQLVERRAGPVFARLRRVLIIQPYGPFTEHDASLPQRRVIPTQPFRVPEVLPFPSTAPGSGRSTRGEPNVLAAAGRTPTHPTGTLHLMTGREQRLTSVPVIAAVIVVGRTAAIDRVPPLEARIFRAINQLPDRALVLSGSLCSSGHSPRSLLARSWPCCRGAASPLPQSQPQARPRTSSRSS